MASAMGMLGSTNANCTCPVRYAHRFSCKNEYAPKQAMTARTMRCDVQRNLHHVRAFHVPVFSIYAFVETHSSMRSVLDETLSPTSERPSRTSAPGHAAERSERQLANPLPACVLKG